jgi:hypothetical protein
MFTLTRELINKHYYQLPHSLTNITAGMMECRKYNAKQGVNLKQRMDDESKRRLNTGATLDPPLEPKRRCHQSR